MLDVQIIHFLHQPVRQVSLIQQAFQPLVPGHDRRRRGKKVLGNFQHRFYLPFDPGFHRNLVSNVQQVGHQINVSGYETSQHFSRIDIRQVDGGVKMGQLLFQLLQQVAGPGLMLMGSLYLLAQCGGVHGSWNS
ncbi:hypothetical protein ALP29_200956 [Pseudomonas syringae pv. avii]|uniref:Uncharacterized protein n=1 Tax=Pseudomonas syringae pv. avii TaxID=663959 RepID=A0A3M5V035_PSESX|nr:hypothetical protein ALP29_200956 [Pseudomonas syringae pv. avii]